MQFRDDAGAEIGSKVCNIIGSDGGTVPYARDHPMPPAGLMLEVAYRWDIVCDFSAYQNRVSSCPGSCCNAAARHGAPKHPGWFLMAAYGCLRRIPALLSGGWLHDLPVACHICS